MEEHFEFIHDNTSPIEEVFVSKKEDVGVFPTSDNQLAIFGLRAFLKQAATEFTDIEWFDLHTDALAEMAEREKRELEIK